MKVIRFFETSDPIRTTWRYIPEDGNMHNFRCDNLKYHKNQRKVSFIILQLPPPTETSNLLHVILLSDIRVVVPSLRRLLAGFPLPWTGLDPGSSLVGFVLDKAALGPDFSEHFSFPCQSFIPLTAPQSSPSIIQGWYNRPISGRSNSGLGSTPALSINTKIRDIWNPFFKCEYQVKKTPWPLVRERTILTEDRHMSTKFSANLCG
jgi:hypothetical protein